MEVEHTDNIEEKGIQEILLTSGFMSEVYNKDGKTEYKISLNGLLLLCSHFLEETDKNNSISIAAIKEPDIDDSINTNIDKYSLTVLSDNNNFGIPIKTFGLQLKNQNNNLIIEEEKEENSKEERKKRIYIYISDLICNKIQSIKGNKTLNFIIWSGSEHNSIMLEHKNNYYFLDSCGYCYERFPHSTINGLIPGKNAFHIESQIQTDDFNCSSFCLEFIKTLYEMYRNKEKQGQDLNEYLQSFFISHGNGEGCEFFVDVVKKKDGDEEVEEDEEEWEEEEIEDDFRRYGLLPPEILIYFQSLSFLKNIQEILFPNYNQGNKNISESNELNEIKKKIEEKQEAIKRTDIQLKEILESKTRSELESLQRLRNYNITILNEKKDKLQNDLLSIANKQQKICNIQQSIIALLPKELQTGDISNLSREERIKYQKINQARKEHIQLLFSLYKAIQQNKSEKQPAVAEETQQQNTSPKATPTKEAVENTKKLTTEVNKSQIKSNANNLINQAPYTPNISKQHGISNDYN